MDVLILRDPREALLKCSLTPLRGKPGIRFETYDPDRRVAAEGRVLLHPEGPELGAAERGRALMLIDCAWRRVPTLLRTVDGPFELRSLPRFATAYPRRSKTFEDPAAGLASIEALYAAVFALEGARPELLAGYRWAREFLELNPQLRAS